jgi:hypothetical protein
VCVCVLGMGEGRAQCTIAHAGVWSASALPCPPAVPALPAALCNRGINTLLNDVEPLLPSDGGAAIAAMLPVPQGGSLLPVLLEMRLAPQTVTDVTE